MKQDLFKRDIDFIDNEYTRKIENILNINTINKWTKHKTVSNFDYQHKDWYLSYRFSVLKTWFDMNKKDNDSNFLDKLEAIIKKLYLKEFLNAWEINYINNVKAAIFTNRRNLKRLVTDFVLNKNEWSYFHYINIDVSNIYKNMNLADLHLTNQRIVIVCKDQTFSFYYDNISKYKFEKNKIVIFYNSVKYEINTLRSNIIKLSLIRMYKMTGKFFDYEY